MSTFLWAELFWTCSHVLWYLYYNKQHCSFNKKLKVDSDDQTFLTKYLLISLSYLYHSSNYLIVFELMALPSAP